MNGLNTLENAQGEPINIGACYAQVFLGDCLELYKNIKPKSVDLILTDLPYGTTQNKWDSIIPFDKLWEMVNYLLKPNGAFITTASQPFTSALVMSNPSMFKYVATWHKRRVSGFLNAKKQPLRSTEDICVFYKKQCKYNPIKKKRKHERDFTKMEMRPHSENYGSQKNYKSTINKDSLAYPTTLIDIRGLVNNEREKVAHPTQKPVALLEYLVKTYSDANMVIFDPFMGSGTTGVACRNTNRNFIGIEKDENYFKIAEQRINARTLFS